MAGKKLANRKRKPKPAKPSHRAEAAYRDDLLQICKYMQRVTSEILLPVLKRTESQYARMPIKGDAAIDAQSARVISGNFGCTFKPVDAAKVHDGYAADIAMAFEQMARAMGGIDAMSQRLAQAAVQRQRVETEVQISRNLSNSLGIDVANAVTSIDVSEEIEAATIVNVNLIKSLPDQYLQKLKTQVLGDVAAGRRYEVIAKDIEHQGSVTESRAKLIARDQMSKVNASINEAKQTDLGIDKYTWSTSGDERVRPTHAAHDGKVFRWDSPPEDTGHPGDDVNCFPGWSEVEFTGDVKRVFRHWYNGKLAFIVTASGKTLHATPNHPVLTDRGWLPAKAIKKGDNLVEIGKEIRQGLEHDQDNRVITSIAEVFEALSVDGVIGTVGAGQANFHGDIPNGDVDVVNAAGSLRIVGNASSIKGGAQLRLSVADGSWSGLRSLEKFGFSARLAANSIMRRAGKLLAFIFCQPCHAQQVGSGAASNFNPGVNQATANNVARDIETVGNREFAFAVDVGGNDSGIVKSHAIASGATNAPVSIDTILSQPSRESIGMDADLPGDFCEGQALVKELSSVLNVEWVDFSGHVYNLETEKGWYATQGIVTHNCRCVAIPVIDI